jgi:hypothetical protein
VAHNRCIDHLRRPMPAASDIFEMSRTPLHDPLEDAQRREDLRRLVTDVGRLPEQQRSALLMREIDGMSYADLASALDVTVPAVKSLLVRARLGLVEAAEARSTDCSVIREDLVAAYDRGVKASGRARRHMRECSSCREYRSALRGVRSSFAALSPGAGAAALVAKLFGIGGGGAAAGGAAAGGGGAAATATGAAAVGGATACKVAAVVCATALTAGGAVEVKNLADHHRAPAHERAAQAAAPAAALSTPIQRRAALSSAAAAAPAPVSAPATQRSEHTRAQRRAQHTDSQVLAPPSIPVYTPSNTSGGAEETPIDEVSGGATAPSESPVTDDPVPDEPAGPLAPEASPTAPSDGSTQPTPGDDTTTTPDDGDVAVPSTEQPPPADGDGDPRPR